MVTRERGVRERSSGSRPNRLPFMNLPCLLTQLPSVSRVIHQRLLLQVSPSQISCVVRSVLAASARCAHEHFSGISTFTGVAGDTTFILPLACKAVHSPSCRPATIKSLVVVVMSAKHSHRGQHRLQSRIVYSPFSNFAQVSAVPAGTGPHAKKLPRYSRSFAPGGNATLMYRNGCRRHASAQKNSEHRSPASARRTLRPSFRAVLCVLSDVSNSPISAAVRPKPAGACRQFHFFRSEQNDSDSERLCAGGLQPFPSDATPLHHRLGRRPTQRPASSVPSNLLPLLSAKRISHRRGHAVPCKNPSLIEAMFRSR